MSRQPLTEAGPVLAREARFAPDAAPVVASPSHVRKDGAVVWGNIEVALQEAQSLVELAMHGSRTAVYAAYFPDGKLESSRWSFLNMWEPLGFDASQMPTRFDELLPLAVHPDDTAALVEQLNAAVQARSPDWYVEHRVLHRDGSVRWRLSRGTLVFDDAGTISSFVGTEVDITQLKRIEHELSRSREAAEAANRAKDDFLANVSHEIRTPMNAILGMSELALDSAPSDHQHQLLSTMHSAAKNLLGIVDDLLDFSKISAGKLALARDRFSLRSVVGETLRALAVRAHRKGIELLSRVRHDVPDGLEGDAGRLRQVLMNLVGNAIKFTAHGEIEVDVGAHPASGPDQVSLFFSVRDTGVGIPLDKQAAIFRAFEQADSSTTRHYGGTGLGLTISAQLVALMGGELEVESAPGLGSVFRFTAPFARASKRATKAEPVEWLRDKRVLVVDDNASNRRILEECLSSWRMQATCVGGPIEALSALTRARDLGAPFALVLLDSRMPRTDSATLASQIRERCSPATTALILLASDDDAALSARWGERGVLAQLLKPVQPSELLAAIGSVLRAAPARRRERARGHRRSECSRRLRVLIAEDNEFNIVLLEELSKRAGYHAQVARDGQTALELAARGTCDLLLVDLHMPALDGFEVMRGIRARERGTARHLPIIALTARSSASDRELCLMAGADEFLSKPVEAAALWSTVRRLLARRSARRALVS